MTLRTGSICFVQARNWQAVLMANMQRERANIVQSATIFPKEVVTTMQSQEWLRTWRSFAMSCPGARPTYGLFITSWDSCSPQCINGWAELSTDQWVTLFSIKPFPPLSAYARHTERISPSGRLACMRMSSDG